MARATIPPRKHGYIKNKKRLLVVLVILLVVIILPTTALAYTGFVPGVTPLMGTNTPVDLGVQYSAADFQSLQQKTQLQVSNFDQTQGLPEEIGKVSPGNQLVLYGPSSRQISLTQQELTAFLNMMPWTASPLSHSQIRLSHGAFEFSGNVQSSYLADLIRTVYPQGDYDNLNPALKLAGHLYNPAMYLKAAVSVANVTNGPSHGQLMLKILALKVNRMDLSSDVRSMNEISVKVPEGSYANGTAYSVSSLAVSDGSLDFYGTLPTRFSVGGGDPSAVCNNYHGGSLISLNAVDGRIGSIVRTCP